MLSKKEAKELIDSSKIDNNIEIDLFVVMVNRIERKTKKNIKSIKLYGYDKGNPCIEEIEFYEKYNL